MNKPITPGPKQRKHLFGFLDETGLLHTPATDRIFGLGLLTLNSTKHFHDDLIKFRQKKSYDQEFKFSHVRHVNLALYKALLDIFFDQINARFCAVILDKKFVKVKGNHNKAYNVFAGELIAEAVSTTQDKQSEYITILADDVSTSIDDAFDREIRQKVSSLLRRDALFGVYRLESHAISEIQVCDVLLGIIAYSFKIREGLITSGPMNAKIELVKYFQTKLGAPTIDQSFQHKAKMGVMVKVTEKTK